MCQGHGVWGDNSHAPSLPQLPTGSQQPLANQLVPICQPSSSPGSEGRRLPWALWGGRAGLTRPRQFLRCKARRPSPELGPPTGKSSGTDPASPLAAGNATARVT